MKINISWRKSRLEKKHAQRPYSILKDVELCLKFFFLRKDKIKQFQWLIQNIGLVIIGSLYISHEL